MKARGVGLALALCLPVVAAAAEGSAGEWLSRMAKAAHTLNYEGTFIYDNAGRIQSMQIFHGTENGGERERLVTLDGAFREVVRDKDTVTCVMPDNKVVVVEDSGPVRPFSNLPTDLEPLRPFYAVSVADAERLVDRSARKIVIAPRDGYRYGQSVWIDEASGLLLKAELVDEHGSVVERLMFTSLQIHDRPLPRATFQLQSGKDRELQRHKPAPAAGPDMGEPSRNWAVTQVPPGFREQVRRLHLMPHGKEPAQHLVFSDGLASVSIFIEREEGHTAAIGPARKGAVNVFVRRLDDHKITVLGEVPEATVRLMGEGVVHEGKP